MSSFWRQAGLTYVHFSSVCARAIRQALKPDLKEKAAIRDQSFLKSVKWEDGKPVTKTAAST